MGTYSWAGGGDLLRKLFWGSNFSALGKCLKRYAIEQELKDEPIFEPDQIASITTCTHRVSAHVWSSKNSIKHFCCKVQPDEDDRVGMKCFMLRRAVSIIDRKPFAQDTFFFIIRSDNIVLLGHIRVLFHNHRRSAPSPQSHVNS